MAELENAFSTGTEGLMVDGKLVMLPANEDWQLVGRITAYDDTIGKVSFTKAWDQAGTPETFYALAKYAGRTGTPRASEVVVNFYAIFYRTGIGNNNFTSATGFQLNEAASVTKASFVVFFF